MFATNMEKNTARELKKACIDKGITITELCRRAGVDRTTVSRWEKKQPQTLAILAKLQQELERA